MRLENARVIDVRGFTGVQIEETVRSAAAALDARGSQELLEILSDDPASERIVETVSDSVGRELLESSHLGYVFRYVIRRHRSA